MNTGNIGSFPAELDLLKESKTRLTYFKGENIYKQGAFAPYVIYIIEGLAKICLQTGSKKQINLRIAGKGDFLALSAVFGESRYSATAIALKDTLTCMIDKDSLGKLLMMNPELAIRISSQNFHHETRLVQLIKSLSYNQMRGKLASALLYLSDPEFLKENIFELLSRQDIADFASISLESAVKFLKEFDKERIIRVEGRLISIEDQDKLMDISLHG